MTNESIEEKVALVWCQHCKALQKASGIDIECWMNPFDKTGFCAANEDAVKSIIPLIEADVKAKLSDKHFNELASAKKSGWNDCNGFLRELDWIYQE